MDVCVGWEYGLIMNKYLIFCRPENDNVPLSIFGFFNVLAFLAIYIGAVVVFFKAGFTGLLAYAVTLFYWIVTVTMFFFMHPKKNKFAWYVALFIVLGLFYVMLFKFFPDRNPDPMEGFALYSFDCMILYYVLVRYEPYMAYVNDRSIWDEAKLNPLRKIISGLMSLLVLVSYIFFVGDNGHLEMQMASLWLAGFILVYFYFTNNYYTFHTAVLCSIMILTFILVNIDLFPRYERVDTVAIAEFICIVYLVMLFRQRKLYLEFIGNNEDELI